MTTNSKNHLIVASAGSGKTTHLVSKAINLLDERILITTFTEANEENIRAKFVKLKGYVPANITIQTWFSFLIEHGVKPYQDVMYDGHIEGLYLESGQSGHYVPETNIRQHYLTKSGLIYSDKLAKFAVRCDEKSMGAVINRLTKIYDQIFIDEVQDLSGWDLDFLKLLFNSSIEILLVGDPRQATYSTSNSSKNKRFQKAQILSFFDDTSLNIKSDSTSLAATYRCIEPITKLSDKLFPNYNKTLSKNLNRTGHDGFYLVRPIDVQHYLNAFKPVQLRDSSRTKIQNDNFGVFPICLRFLPIRGL